MFRAGLLIACMGCRYGVSCCPTTPSLLSSGCSTAFSQSVAVLELNDFNLSGSLPTQLGVFQSLSALSIGDNPGDIHALLAAARQFPMVFLLYLIHCLCLCRADRSVARHNRYDCVDSTSRNQHIHVFCVKLQQSRSGLS